MLGELRPRDPGRKAEIVLDPRAGPRLPARRDGLGGQHVEPLGRRIDRGRQSGGAGAHDHDEVVDVSSSMRETMPDAGADVAQRGIAVPVAVAVHHDRRGRGGDVELAEQRVRLLVGLEIEEPERDARCGWRSRASRCASGEKREPMMRDALEPLLEQQSAAGQERLDDRLAQLGQLVHRPAELAAVELQTRPSSVARASDQGGAAGQQVHVAGELARPGGRPPCAACRANARRSRPGPSSTRKNG